MNRQINNRYYELKSIDTRFDIEELSKSIREISKSFDDIVRIQSDIPLFSVELSKILDKDNSGSSVDFNPFETNSSIGELSSAPTTIIIDNSSSYTNLKEDLLSLLSSSDNTPEDIDRIEEKFSYFLAQDKSEALDFLSKTFMSSLEKEGDFTSVQVAILRLICRYGYDELSPYSQLIAGNARVVSSLAVKSATFDVYDHWSNIPSYNILLKMDMPIEPWLQMKYEALIDSIAEKYAIRKEVK